MDMWQRLILIAGLVIGTASMAQGPPDDDDEPAPKVLAQWVDDLGSDDFRLREAAVVALRKIGEDAVPFLRRRQDSPDVELRRRALDLLADIEKKGQRFCSSGHEKGVIALALVPGDLKVLTAGEDTSVRLWDLTDGKELRRFDGHTSQVWAVAVAPDGKSFASSGQDRTIRIGAVDGETKPRVLATLPNSVRCLLFAPDGKRIFAGCFDAKIHVINAETGKTEATWPGHMDAVLCMALSPDGSKIASGGAYKDATVIVRNVSDGKIVQQLVGHREYVYAVAFVGNDRVVSAGFDNIIRLWHIKTGKIEREFKGHTHGIYALAVSRDGKRILTGAFDKVIRLWDVASGDELRRYSQHTDGINALAFTANGRYALSAGNDGTLRTWYLPRVPRR